MPGPLIVVLPPPQRKASSLGVRWDREHMPLQTIPYKSPALRYQHEPRFLRKVRHKRHSLQRQTSLVADSHESLLCALLVRLNLNPASQGQRGTRLAVIGLWEYSYISASCFFCSPFLQRNRKLSRPTSEVTGWSIITGPVLSRQRFQVCLDMCQGPEPHSQCSSAKKVCSASHAASLRSPGEKRGDSLGLCVATSWQGTIERPFLPL